MRRFLATLHARNMEFLRDRSSLAWNVLMPVLLVFGLAFVFSDGDRDLYKVAVLQSATRIDPQVHPFLQTRFIKFYAVQDRQLSLDKVRRHQIDMLLDLTSPPGYWINEEAPKGYVLEKILRGSGGAELEKRGVTGKAIRYIDWLVPGILGMNMMYSCLFGVGYVVVRYRKSGFLKRLNATPLHAVEFLCAQVMSRLLLIMAITVGVYVGTDWFLDFRMEGSYLALLLVAILGATSMIALGLLVAARVTSEEVAGGILNFLSWPMMVVSGVWFSLEGSNPGVQKFAQLFPLTPTMDAARAIMLEGAGVRDIAGYLLILLAMTLVFLAAGSLLFRWKGD